MTKQLVLLIMMLFSGLHVSAQEDLFMAGRADMMRGEYHLAITQFDKALEINQGDTEILFQRGICYFNLNNNPEAREAFYSVEKRREGMGSFYLAKTEVRLNHPELALKYLRIHLSSRYKVPEKVILLDRELSKLEETEGWQNLWNEKAWYSQGDREFQEAQFLKENDQALEAINLLNKLEKQGYARSKVQAEKAEVYTMLDNPKAARSELQSAVKSDVRNMDALFTLASFQVKEGDTEQALTGLNRVIRQEPDRFEAYLVRATARSDQENLSGALDDLNLFLLYFPDHHEVYYQRGTLQHAHGKYLDAIQSFNRALEMDQGSAIYFYARGLTYAATGTTRYAEKDLAMALDLDPYNGDVWYEKGKLSEQLGKVKEACSCYQKAFQYGIFEAGEKFDNLCN